MTENIVQGALFTMMVMRVGDASGAALEQTLRNQITRSPQFFANAPIVLEALDFPDMEINPLGARGIGEIGLAGVAAAITAAVHHATGVRIRELPVRIEDLLT